MTKKKIAFTIVARNYYGLAQVLRQSVLQHDDDVDFIVFVADGIPNAHGNQFGADAVDGTAVMRLYVSEEKLLEAAFKYNLTEFCTAIKPFCFKYLFDTTDASEAVYLDPDVLVFSSMAPVFDKLATASIVLTPHILFPSSLEGKRTDKGIMATGIYNLGFVGLRRSKAGTTFANWWGQRLLDQCFVDSHDALFTDQKWADFVPALFPEEDVCVLRHCGTNLAPWNFHERQVSADADGRLIVQRRADPSETLPIDVGRAPEPVVFVHFSGFDYKRLCSGEVAQYNIDGLSIYPDLQPLIDQYMAAIQARKEAVLQFLGMSYLYAAFQDGSPIIAFHRRLYRSAVESNLSVGNPFVTGAGSFHQRLAERRLLTDRSKAPPLDMFNKNNLAGMERKLAKVNKIMRGLKQIIGFQNYVLLLRLMRPYSRAESQLHLIDPSKDKL